MCLCFSVHGCIFCLVVDEMENLVPDVVEDSPHGASQGDLKPTKPNLKSQFRSLALDAGASKLSPRPRWLEEV